MTEIQILSGKCTCGKRLEERIFPPQEKDEQKIWLIYGVCKKCKMVYMQTIFTEEEPKENRDFIIDYEKCGDKNGICKF